MDANQGKGSNGFHQDEASNDTKPAYMSHRTAESRSLGYTPSYMSSIASRQTGSSAGGDAGIVLSSNNSISIPLAPNGRLAQAHPDSHAFAQPARSLLILTPATIHPSLALYVRTLLRQQSFSSIVIVGSETQEAELKQLKMDIYALLGKLKMEAGVYTQLMDDWTATGVADAVDMASRRGAGGLQGVLLCPPPPATGDPLGEEQAFGVNFSGLDESWQHTVALFRDVARATIPQLEMLQSNSRHGANGSARQDVDIPFVAVTQLTTPSAASQVTKAAFDTLLQVLGQSAKSRGIFVGYVDTLLASASMGEDGLDVPADEYLDEENEPFRVPLSESPTKLWNMWALNNELGSPP